MSDIHIPIKRRIANRVAKRLGCTRQQDAIPIIDAVLDSIAELICEDREVKLSGFGTLSCRWRAGRSNLSLPRGKPSPGKVYCRFKESKELGERLNRPRTAD